MGKYRYALQLYTVRDHMEKDVPGTLDKVCAAGYQYVEVAGTYGLPWASFQKALAKANLKACGAHMGYEEITQNPRAAIDVAQALQIRYIIIPCIDQKFTANRQGWIDCAKAMSAAGKILREAGIKLCYHNHAHEFQLLEGERIIDIVMQNSDPEHLFLELDVFWARYAGYKPETVIEKYTGRCPVLHVKDMTDAKSRAFTEVGRGLFDWPFLLEVSAAAGTKWFVVEQDSCAKDSLESARISATFMSEQ